MNGTGIFGDREVIAALLELADLPVADIDKSAIASMQPMLDETREHYRLLRQTKANQKNSHFKLKKTPPGQHLDQLLVVRKTKGNKVQRQYWLSARGRAKSLAHLVEFGTAPHYQPKRKWMHPGARPKPGMAPAFEAHGDEVVEGMGTALWELLRERALTIGKKSRTRR